MFFRSSVSLWLARAALACGLLLQPGASAQSAVDDCGESQYLDRRAAAADRALTWDYSIAGDPERCLVIQVGQSVHWQGNFGDHPLDPDQGDTPNPIAGHAAGLVTFDRPGVFGFRCNFHLSMRGAIKVVPAAAAPVPAMSGAWLGTLASLLLGLTWVLSPRRRVT